MGDTLGMICQNRYFGGLFKHVFGFDVFVAPRLSLAQCQQQLYALRRLNLVPHAVSANACIQLAFTLTGVPEHKYAEISKVCRSQYWDKMKAAL